MTKKTASPIDIADRFLKEAAKLRLTPEQDEAIRAYLIQPKDGSRAEVDAKDRVFDAFVTEKDTGRALGVQTRINKAMIAARKAGYPYWLPDGDPKRNR